MTGHSYTVASHEDPVSREYFHHSSAQRVNTDLVLVEALRTQYPNLELVIVPQQVCNLLAYAASGFATATPLEDAVRDPVYGVGVKWRYYMPPSRRLDSGPGAFAEMVVFGKFMYKWQDHEAILYVADGRDGMEPYPAIRNQYILTTNEHKLDELLKQCGIWGQQLHNEVWVFDQGYWQKSAELYNSVQKASWEDVILDEDMKKTLISDVENFFDGRKTYEDLKVPWKRGVIYYGPPGNGKTISIKAMMHMLYQRGIEGDDRMAVPTLYVRTLASFGGPEYSLRSIFAKARQEAPCYLVFEDLDSIVNDNVRSYFLNEVDGLKSNDGILMVGSTNHLDRLDPGIAKRPSRFDRKYFFPNPDFDQRVQYAKFWQGKLESNKDLDFPDKLCTKIAEITGKFSFAYMQEAFVASLLAIAVRGGKDEVTSMCDAHRWAGPQDPMIHVDKQARRDHVHKANFSENPDFDNLELWVEMQKQVKILREEMEDKRTSNSNCSRNTNTFDLPSRPRVGTESLTRYRDELDALLHGRRTQLTPSERSIAAVTGQF
tara:strand:- start:3803 stop:5437 length:1635 start_codon:yes stop_codon:yes gene_type:complete